MNVIIFRLTKQETIISRNRNIKSSFLYKDKIWLVAINYRKLTKKNNMIK